MTGQRGRPVRPELEVQVVVHLRLREGEDDDLIAFFQAVPSGQRAQRLKLALRSGGMQMGAIVTNEVSDQELDDALDGFLF